MQLDIGNVERIDEPTPEQIAHHLRNLPSESPFAVLSGDDELYIQALADGDVYRVELRQGDRHRYALVEVDRAIELFLAFNRWDAVTIDAADWRPSTLRSRAWPLIVLFSLLVAVVALSLWMTLR